MKKVIKKFPGTKWADLAAYRLLDNKTCGEWAAEAKCPEMEATLYMKYVDEHPQVAEDSGSAVQGGMAVFGVDRDLQVATTMRKKAADSTARAISTAKTNHDAVSRHHRLGDPGGATAVHGADPKYPTYGNAIAVDRLVIAWRHVERLPARWMLGIIEGLTEFLPVSSTAHLRIAESLLGIDLANGYWKMFSIVIQLGAILCLPLYFWNRIWEFVSDFPRGTRGDRTVLNHPLTLTAIAFVMTAIPAFLLTKTIGKHLESLYVMAYALIIGGIVMWLVDAIYERSEHRAFARGQLTEDMEEMSIGQAVWIGLCQVLSAVFPGTSRSMATITAGELAGMSRPAALEFSFFLSIPTMVAATVYDLWKSMRPHHGEPIGDRRRCPAMRTRGSRWRSGLWCRSWWPTAWWHGS